MKAKKGYGKTAARAAMCPGAYMPRKVAPKKKRNRAWCRYPEQRDALARLGWTASDLRDWLSCEYLRARGLRGGNLMLTGCELAIIQEHSPVGGVQLARDIALSKGDVRLAQLCVDFDQGQEGDR